MSWMQKKCVVVPVDFSEDSFAAVDTAREFVDDSSHLHLIHVTQPWTEHEIGGSWGQESEDERLKSLEQFIQDKLKGAGYADAQIAVRMGSPPVEIVQYAKDSGAELIVMPSHGRTGFQHFALGSVAERVLRKAHCPVLVLKKDHQDEQSGKKIISYD